jgi:hypothetical protein
MVGMDTGTPAPVCGHSYKTLGGRRFVCDAAPHPNHPDAHYFVRAKDDGAPAPRSRRLVVIPGERRG